MSAPESATGWIAVDRPVERVQLDATSWVDVVRGFLAGPEVVHDELVASVAWEQGRVFRYERWIDEPRLGSWQAGPRRHPALAEAEAWISRRYRVRFDGVALAHYRNERDSVAFHRDREMRWLDDTVVAVLTLGAQRPWLLRPRRSEQATHDLSPASGDLLVMGGRCQADWEHSVPKVAKALSPRISVQWRWTSRRGRPEIGPSYRAPRSYT
jgi:alkylated DNA repair dioxygenase AlkB